MARTLLAIGAVASLVVEPWVGQKRLASKLVPKLSCLIAEVNQCVVPRWILALVRCTVALARWFVVAGDVDLPAENPCVATWPLVAQPVHKVRFAWELGVRALCVLPFACDLRGS